MAAILTETDFDGISWHDCHIWGVEFHVGDVDAGEWTSDLVFDIDYITEWICRPSGGQFRVAPVTLRFYGVTDLSIRIDWGDSGFRCALHQASIDRIEREQIPDQRIYLDRPYYRWTIRLNWPQSGTIAFGSPGFTQTLCGEPVLLDGKQRLSIAQRERARAPR